MFAALICLTLLAVATPAQIRQISTGNKKELASTTPIKLIYIDGLTSWWGNLTLPAALGVPGYTKYPLAYNYICHAFWTYPGNAVDAAGMWAQVGNNMGPNDFGTTNLEIQTTLKKNFTNNGVKLLVSAFGSTQSPTSAGVNVTDCAIKLAKFVIDNQYDGVDIDWEDTPAFNNSQCTNGTNGLGENWLISLTKLLRQKLPAGSIITHAPQAPYLSNGLYPCNAYIYVDQQVGSMIDFYNVQFYNQGVGMYDTADGLFNVSGGWAPYSSVNEITTIGGVPASKVVLGKPATKADGNNGWMSAADLNAAITANYAYNKWNTGIMFWQFTNDLDSSMCINSTSGVFMPRDNYEDIGQLEV